MCSGTADQRASLQARRNPGSCAESGVIAAGEPKIRRCVEGSIPAQTARCTELWFGYPQRRRVVSVPGAAGERCFTAVMPRDDSATAMAVCAGCAASWRGMGRAHCRVCHVTFDDLALFDAHRRTVGCVPPQCLSLVMVGGVWCRLLAAGQTATC